MQPALLSPPLHDDVAYWLLRLSESLNRLNNGLLWSGSSPGELDRVLAPAQLRGSDLALDVIHAAACMRRFASEVFEPPLPSTRPGASIWEDLMIALRTMLAACGQDSELWAAGMNLETAPELVRELRATVYAIERLCGHFERVH